MPLLIAKGGTKGPPSGHILARDALTLSRPLTEAPSCDRCSQAVSAGLKEALYDALVVGTDLGSLNKEI